MEISSDENRVKAAPTVETLVDPWLGDKISEVTRHPWTYFENNDARKFRKEEVPLIYYWLNEPFPRESPEEAGSSGSAARTTKDVDNPQQAIRITKKNTGEKVSSNKKLEFSPVDRVLGGKEGVSAGNKSSYEGGQGASSRTREHFKVPYPASSSTFRAKSPGVSSGTASASASGGGALLRTRRPCSTSSKKDMTGSKNRTEAGTGITKGRKNECADSRAMESTRKNPALSRSTDSSKKTRTGTATGSSIGPSSNFGVASTSRSVKSGSAGDPSGSRVRASPTSTTVCGSGSRNIKSSPTSTPYAASTTTSSGSGLATKQIEDKPKTLSSSSAVVAKTKSPSVSSRVRHGTLISTSQILSSSCSSVPKRSSSVTPGRAAAATQARQGKQAGPQRVKNSPDITSSSPSSRQRERSTSPGKNALNNNKDADQDQERLPNPNGATAEVLGLRLRNLEQKHLLVQEKRQEELVEMEDLLDKCCLLEREASLSKQERIRYEAALSQNRVEIEILQAKVAMYKTQAAKMATSLDQADIERRELQRTVSDQEQRAAEKEALLLYYQVRERDVTIPLEEESAKLREDTKRLQEQVAFLSGLLLEKQAINDRKEETEWPPTSN
ncbi:unnamed protein product [Amoebophrya sp. A25]|nr:unnamed protein product [Amoebophrya sp. A25]|eukprot:GSA25T00007697001.1